MKKDTEYLIERENGFKVIAPLSSVSAKKWSENTQWGTSKPITRDPMKEHNTFQEEVAMAPLLIVITSDGQKAQIWKMDGNVSFVDSHNKEVSMDFIRQNWNDLEPLIEWMGNIKYIPEEYRTHEAYLNMVSRDGYQLEFIPDKDKTYDICMEAVKQHGGALHFVPEQFKNLALYDAAIEQNAYSLNAMDLNTLSEDDALYICEKALKQNPEVAYIIESSYKNPKVQKLIAENPKANPETEMSFQNFDAKDSHSSSEDILRIYKKDFDAIKENYKKSEPDNDSKFSL